MTSVLDQIQNNPNGAAYFNGTMCPLISDGDCQFEDRARQMIKGGVVNGYSLQELGDLYYEQMEALVGALCRICGDQKYNSENITAWCEEIGMTQTEAMTLWYLNVRALLILGKIEDNDKFGMMFNTQVRTSE
mgnify:CR=1 FL=1|jgi:hypothetical protein